jgi:hypothetical protein
VNWTGVENPDLPVLDYVGAFIDRFHADVERRVRAAGEAFRVAEPVEGTWRSIR